MPVGRSQSSVLASEVVLLVLDRIVAVAPASQYGSAEQEHCPESDRQEAGSCETIRGLAQSLQALKL